MRAGRSENHSGSITKEPSGVWRGRVMVNGTRRSVSGASRSEVAALIRAVVAEAEGAAVRQTRLGATFGEAQDAWLAGVDERVRSGRAKRTTASYYRAMAAHSEPLRDIRLDRLSTADVEAWLRGLGGSGSTRRGALLAVKQSLKEARRLGWVPRNVAESVEAPSPRAEREVLHATAADVDALVAASPSPYRELWVLLAWTGLRIGEGVALRWDDVDLVNATLRVREGKTARARRTVPLHPEAVKALRTLPRDSAWVFRNESGGPLDRSKATRVFRSARPRPGLTPHSLRHGFVTRLLERGVPVHIVSVLAGHADVSTTMDIYSHSVSSLERDAIARLDG